MIFHTKGILLNKREIADNTMEMSFRIADKDFMFKSGQYAAIGVVGDENSPAHDRYHDFSFASSPKNPQEVSFAFRISQSPFKTALLSLPLGGEVSIDAPKGVLGLPENPETPVVFIAGGIGITPFMSMMRHETETRSSRKITLLYFNVSKETESYREEIKALVLENHNISVQSFYGIPERDLFVEEVAHNKDATWYVIGVPVMVEKVQQILQELGIMDTQIHVEEFSGYRVG